MGRSSLWRKKTIKIEEVDNAHTIKGPIEEPDEKKVEKVRANLAAKYDHLTILAGR